LTPSASSRSRLGEILLKTGAITDVQLRQALDDQARHRQPIGQTLLALGFVTDEVMRQALGAQLHVPYIDLDRVTIDPGLAALVDRTFAEQHLLMPVARIGPTLTVAMDDPTASAVVEDLARRTGLTITVVTSSAQAIADAFARVWGEPPRGAARQPPEAEEAAAPRPALVELSIDWIGDMQFRSSAGQPAIELHSSTPGIASPPQALAYAVMACMAMDVVHILKKTRCDLKAMTVRCQGERAAGQPRRFVSLRLHFDITGRTAPHIVERAIELSRTRYCSVWNTLRTDVKLETGFSISDEPKDERGSGS
jgi:uncharacterized OsmC-like protein